MPAQIRFLSRLLKLDFLIFLPKSKVESCVISLSLSRVRLRLNRTHLRFDQKLGELARSTFIQVEELNADFWKRQLLIIYFINSKLMTTRAQTADHPMSLLDAAYCLDELAVGRTPDPARLLAGALALHSRRLMGTANQSLLDAGAGLEALATGGTLDLSEDGQARAAVLAALVRKAAEHE